MKSIKYFPLVLLFIIGCTYSNNPAAKDGEALAKTYCGSCHLFPDPALLDKRTWKEDVLPAMARQLGIDHIFETALPDQKPAVSVKEWKEILSYYINAAPAILPGQDRQPVKEITNLFNERALLTEKGVPPSASFIKIDGANHRIYAANAFDSSVNIYNAGLQLLSHNNIHAAVVDINFNTSLQQSGLRTGTFTDIGMMNPNDRQTGSANSFGIDEKGKFSFKDRLFDSISRPAQIVKYDLDKDGKQDYLVCGFGNTKGALYWMRATEKGFEKRILSPFPGALRAYIEDLNDDGLPDIVVLMAQAREGISIFINKGNGEFDRKEVLAFPPVYGSSYFELVDFNKDGFKDILYTCGDNDDYSSKELKYYHGIYIYLNDGKNNFSQQYFFPVHGCYKAMARDFDKDGDLDIAAISFYPDTKNQPQEAFIYLEQTTTFHFSPFTVNASDEGRWMTMDAGDVDGDGYEDIILGSLVQPIPAKIKQWEISNKQKTALLLLHNNGKTILPK
ncbi:MAG: FG-GAP-like repeat-containing protein [Ferruginibacter sp.]